MSRSVSRTLGEEAGREHVLHVEVWPDWNRPDEFVATVYYRERDHSSGTEETVEVARIENRAHGHTHVDRLWTAEQDKAAFDGGVYAAWRRLRENWRVYARRHHRNHR